MGRHERILEQFAGTGAPVGYQPSAKYWRANVAEPARFGHDMEVPDSVWYEASPAPEAEFTLWPGEQTVGLYRLSSVGPRLVEV